jgi:Fe-S-cluster-containing dehydrogenase component
MGIDRRSFLKRAGLIGTAGVAGGALPAKAVEHFTGWPDRYGVLTDLTLCIGRNCRKCEEACKKVNDLPPPEYPLDDNSVFDIRRRMHADDFTVVNEFPQSDPNKPPTYVKIQCMHCNEPACASACLVHAFSKTPEGSVMYNPDVCIGCRYCMTACPFNVPAYEYDEPFTPRVMKCTLCYPRIIEGKRPGCVEACPKEAMTFGKRDDLIKLAREKIRAHPDLYVDHIYGEHEVGGTSWLYVAGRPFEELGFRTDLGTTPYPKLTMGFLSAVPMVLVIWPVMLTGFYRFSKSREKTESDTSVENHQRNEVNS